MKRILLISLLLLLLLAGCANADTETVDSPVSSAPPASSSQPGEEGPAQMTWEMYVARGGDGANYAWLEGTVTAAEKRDDSYGTPYYHLVVDGADGHEYKLVSNYHALPFDFQVGARYHFTVYTAAARGVLVAEVAAAGDG